jgi:hypothetical protein
MSILIDISAGAVEFMLKLCALPWPEMFIVMTKAVAVAGNPQFFAFEAKEERPRKKKGPTGETPAEKRILSLPFLTTRVRLLWYRCCTISLPKEGLPWHKRKSLW